MIEAAVSSQRRWLEFKFWLPSSMAAVWRRASPGTQGLVGKAANHEAVAERPR